MSKVYVFLAEGFEEIEGLTVVDLLRRANIETEMVSVMEGKQIKGSHGIKVTADSMFADVDFSDADMQKGKKSQLSAQPQVCLVSSDF